MTAELALPDQKIDEAIESCLIRSSELPQSGEETPESEGASKTIATYVDSCMNAAQFYIDACNRLRVLHVEMQTIANNAAATFPDSQGARPFSLRYNTDSGYRGGYGNTNDIEDVFKTWKREAWRNIFQGIGVRNLMNQETRKEFDDNLEKGELPELTPVNVGQLICDMVRRAREFANGSIREVFNILIPWRNTHKTNSHFRVGRKVILANAVSDGYTRWQCYGWEPRLIMIDNVFTMLDGHGIYRTGDVPLVAAIRATPMDKGTCETEYFRCKMFKNGNLHIEFKRLDLVRLVNLSAAGEYVLGND